MPLALPRSHFIRRRVLSTALALSSGVGWAPIAGAVPSGDVVAKLQAPEASTTGASAASAAATDGGGASSSPRRPVANPWRAWEGRHYRMTETGDVSCYSEDGEHCSNSEPVPARTDRSINCMTPRPGPWRGMLTGYQRQDHWCNIAYANLFAKWTSYRPLGYPVVLSTNPRGDVMCKSFDGTSCLAPGKHESAGSRPLNPVVCGRLLMNRASFAGYDDPAHWCSSPELLRRDKPANDALPYIHAGRRALSRRHSIALNPWAAREVPTWIVRFRVPEPGRSGAELQIEGRDASHHEPNPAYSRPLLGWPRSASLGALETSALVAMDFDATRSFRRQLVDSKGHGVLAIRVEKDGRLRYFQAPGWHGFRALDPYELDPWNTWRKLAVANWTGSQETRLTFTTSLWRNGSRRLFDESDLRDPPLAIIKDVLVTRQRPTPPEF